MRKRLTSHKKWRFPLIRWHRRIGITVSLLVLWLSVTGILLNHSDQLRLPERQVGQSMLLPLYGISPPVLRAGEHWLSHLGANHVYLDEREVAYCTAPFSGAVWLKDQYIVGCGDSLLLLTREGEVLERLGAVYGFPQPIIALAVVSANLEGLDWQPYDGIASDIHWAASQPAPDSLAVGLLKQSTGGNLTWERVLLDLHNGRLVGQLGVWLLDASALFLIILALSGIWIWVTKPSR
jgi:PepSY-associated TM region